MTTNDDQPSNILIELPSSKPHTIHSDVVDDTVSNNTSSAFALDTAQPLDPQSFPNPPRRNRGPAATIPNTQHMLGRYGITTRYDVIKKKLLVTMPGHSGSPDNFDNVALTYILSLAILNDMSTGHIAACVEAIGDRNQFNPVAEWIKSKPWDRVDRLADFYRTLVQRADFPQELKELLIHRWALSAVAAALKPQGFRCRGVLTLQGPQSIGKTAWAKALVSDEALRRSVIKVDHYLDGNNKDTIIGAVTHWIVEIGELDSSFKKDVARLKGFLTADCDKLRRPYGKLDSEYQRRTVFLATVNEETFLVDSTGNTRWWTLPLTAIDYMHDIDMQQLWAQLAVELDEGAIWWLTKPEEQWLESHNNAHRSVSAIRERLLDKLDLAMIGASGLNAYTASGVLNVLGIEHPSNAQCKECGGILREILGDPKRITGRDKWRVPFRMHSMSAHDDTYAAVRDNIKDTDDKNIY